MSEIIDAPLDNANIPVWQSGLTQAINDTYSYANNSLFYALAPTYYRDYLIKYVRQALYWLDGYVPTVHQAAITGVVSTRLATRLISGLTKQIVGEKLIFKLNDRDIGNSHDQLRFVSKWAEDSNIMKAVYGAIGFSCAAGTSLLKMNKTADNNIWWEAVRFDNCYYLTDFKDEVKEATFMIRNYADTRQGHNNEQFYLVEHRYWKYFEPEIFKKLDGTVEVIHAKGDKEPYVVYEVHHCKGTTLNNLNQTSWTSNKIKWQELPKEIRDNLKKDYSVIRLDEEQPLGFINLGCEPLRNANLDLSVPTGTGFGESLLVPIQDDLITYELASSYLIRDMYLGKGTVYKPKSLSLGDVIAEPTLNTMPETAIETVSGVNPDEQKIVVNQFQLRAQEWQVIKENSLRNIAVKWNTNAKLISSFIANGQAQMTATQIDSEDDVAIAFISHERAYFLPAINRLLDTTLNFYGKPVNVKIAFASPSLVNKDRLLQRIAQELQLGLIDMEEAIRTLNPDLDEEALQKKIDDANLRQQQMQLQQMAELTDNGDFGDIADDPSGSTAPLRV